MILNLSRREGQHGPEGEVRVRVRTSGQCGPEGEGQTLRSTWTCGPWSVQVDIYVGIILNQGRCEGQRGPEG